LQGQNRQHLLWPPSEIISLIWPHSVKAMNEAV